MKIGIVSPEFPPAIGGVETYAHQFVRALARMRPEWEISVFTRPHPQGEIEIPGVRVVPALRWRRRLDSRLFGSTSVDAWHVMNAAYGWLCGEAPNVVVSVHGNDFLRPYLPLLRPDLQRFLPLGVLTGAVERWEQEWSRARLLGLLARTLPRARCILTNSRYTEQVFLERFPQCRGRTRPALVGVGSDFRPAGPRAGAGEGVPRLVTVSRLSEPRKNLDRVLRALARLAGRHRFTYRIVGEGWDRPRLEALAAELGLADRVQFMGRLPQEEMVATLAGSDLFILASSVLPDSHEGFGIVYLEANACGTPVLAARVGGAVEAVAEGVSGMFVENVDEAALEAALGAFLRGEVTFSAEACVAFAREFSWERVVEAALACYEPAAA